MIHDALLVARSKFWMSASVLLGAVSVLACDDVVKVRNLAPEVGVRGLCAAEGRLFFEVTVQDLEEDDVDVEITAGGKPILVGPVGDGALALRSDRDFPGRHHWIEWAAAACEGDESAGCPTALCHSLSAGVLANDAACAPRAGAPFGARIGIAATDGDDASSTRAVTAEELGAGPDGGARACDFSEGAHE